MPTVKTQFVLLLLLGLLDLSGMAGTSASQSHGKAKTAAKQEAPTPVAPAPQPPSPAQMPASPPQVAYTNGSLTIVARNSTLGDILRAVHSQTGAVMEISGSATERVMSSFGPGTPRDVLAQLLNGSNFNYVILGSPADAGLVQRVILTPKLGGDEETQAQNAPMPPTPAVSNSVSSVQAPQQSSQQHMADDDSDDSSDADADDQPTPAPGSDQPANQQANPQAPKTPEQLLQELQKQQLQQQQQQQQGGNPPPNQR